MTIGSTLASSKVFTNSGNIIKTYQNCTAGNSCSLSSSNVITPSTSPSLGTSQSPPCGNQEVVGETDLTVEPGTVSMNPSTLEVKGALTCSETAAEIPGAHITFTGTGIIPSPFPIPSTTDTNGQYFAELPITTTPGTYTVQAHFAGSFDLQPSDSAPETFTVR